VTTGSATTSLAQLVLVRHGESTGNVADTEARRTGSGRVEVETRDPDTPLSPRGEEQARALARRLASLGRDDRPEVVLSSPYTRAARTAEIATEGLELRPVLDERLRERDLGAFDGLTGTGIREHFPEEAERRSRLGKFYYRPPGGESWTDVALRVRLILSDLAAAHSGRRVWVFTHQAVIMSFRLALEGLDEQRLLEVDRSEPLANCSVTRYGRVDGGPLRLEAFAETSHLEGTTAPTTHERTAADAPGPEPAGTPGVEVRHG
jgi:broad specificity phosphatase PhoE